ncbi:hypothetical protein ACLOJK_008103 [Asimina triloba]
MVQCSCCPAGLKGQQASHLRACLAQLSRILISLLQKAREKGREKKPTPPQQFSLFIIISSFQFRLPSLSPKKTEMKKLSKTHFPNTTHFPSLLLSDLTSLCTFIHSHPLYFAYLIFFFPYIRPLLSFLYPLLLSTSLLLLSLLTTFPHLDNTPRNGFFVNAAKLVLDVLHTSIDGDDDSDDYTKLGILEPLALELEAIVEPTAMTYGGSETRERRDEESLQILAQAFSYDAGDEHVGMIGGDGKENYGVVGLESCQFGSMRRDKEWKRTLACKLYEERQMVDGIEGMDLLWEVHEVDSGKFKVKNKEEKKKEKKRNLAAQHKEEEEDEDIDAQLCCLQALRFSTAKMNLGMGRINSMRISKAFKGMGLFMRRERKIP